MKTAAFAVVASLAAACATTRAETPPARATAAPAASAHASSSTPTVKPGKVDGATAAALAKDGARVVDVRTPQEFASGHVPGAFNIPYDEVERRAAEVGPPSAEVIVYCRTGRRSAVAAQTLERLGYRKVYDLGSISAWPTSPPSGSTPAAPPVQTPGAQ